MNFLKRWTHLPTPQELGWTDHRHGLRIRELQPFRSGRTWDEWREYVRAQYPARYFVRETIPDAADTVLRKTRDALYWLKCHTLPAYRFHLLDLRGVDRVQRYSYGYTDPREVMTVAGWAALDMWVKEEPFNPHESDEEEEDPELLAQHIARYDEAMTLHRWWFVERAGEHAEIDREYGLYSSRRQELVTARDHEGYEALTKEWLARCQTRDEKEQAMWMRLAALREYLWT